jgi:TPR repeat protein
MPLMATRLASLCILQLVLISNAFSQSALEQDAPVTDCDTYAASDADPQRKAEGVASDKLSPALAIPACEAAVRQYPDSGRLMFQLGRAYVIAKNYDAAAKQYRNAAERGHALAQNNLGGLYASGKGVPHDDVQAAAWVRKAAEQGYSPAQSNLGFMYADGQGVARDDAQAAVWLRKAADQGLPRAQYKLGVMYDNGQGVPRDTVLAAAWYRKAAEQGFEEAKTRLNELR